VNIEEAQQKLGRWTSLASSGCLEWIGGRDWDGYGLVKIGGRSYRAHRVAFVMAGGILLPGQVVRHSCDNPPCCTPVHLLAGSVADNNRDRELRGRSDDRRGERCPTAKLTVKAVTEIRRRLACGEPHLSIAHDYAVSRKAISKIAHRETWKEVV
jgi:hypothetical protein